MLHRHILVSHLLRLILRMDQRLVKILTDILIAALYLCALPQRLLRAVHDQTLIDPHLLHELEDQAVLLRKQRI